MIKAILSFLWGGFVGLVATALHNAYVPFGLIFSLLFIAVGVWVVGRKTYSRSYKFISLAGLIAIVLRAAISGTGKEVLILSNTTGTFFLVFGTIIAVVMALRPAN